MMKMSQIKKAQTVIEYVLLIIIVAMAFLAMNVYLRRAVNAKLRDIELETAPTIIIKNK